jgi:NTE family protein
MSTLLERLRGRRVGVVLSAGFFGFFGHAGFWKALVEAGVRPVAWAGTSAGGMVAAFAASGAKVEDVEALLGGLKKGDFWDPDVLGAAWGALRGTSEPTGLLKGRRFRALLERHLPVSCIEACPTPLLLVAANLSRGSSAILSNGPLAEAVHATCAYPGLFRAVEVGGELLWDGGLVDKAPLCALAESAAGAEVDTFLVHYLPTRAATAPTGALAYARGISTGVAALRHAHFQRQVELLRAKGKEVVVLEAHLPAVSPSSLSTGKSAFEAAWSSTREALGLQSSTVAAA